MSEPDSQSKLLVVLDLDGTLIHTGETGGSPLLSRLPDFFVDGDAAFRRPGLAAFIDFVTSHFDVGVWTAASESYAQSVIGAVFPDPSVLKFVYSAAHSILRGEVRKDLTKLPRPHDLCRTGLIDDTEGVCPQHDTNLIRVPSWTGVGKDEVLVLLGEYLCSLPADVQSVDKRGWLEKSLRP